ILMGNLLENAISECKKLKELNRPASIQIKLVEKESKFAEKNSQLPEKNSQFVFTVCNPVVQKVEITDNKVEVVNNKVEIANNKTKITDNKIQNVSWNGHGIGLSNVSEVVEKYNGSFAISCDEKEFTAVVII
ncbi:MAG: GHKL domain-containing protein, partial [Lachnospiraceae bacterium]|nr:GHKL domain-containing protein [Lachnospiraceae bacterium]